MLSEQPQQLEWTPELVRRFWKFQATQQGDNLYFSQQVAAAIGRLLQFVGIQPSFRVLDYGCGPGYLAPHLLRLGVRVCGVDYSPDSVQIANERFAGLDRWEGARVIESGTIPGESASFDVVICLETIEHTLEEELPMLFREVHRLLRPNGVALFTTPNAERLQDKIVFCANCGVYFHSVQHIRSWNAETLGSALSSAGFLVQYCTGLNLWDLEASRKKPLLDLSARDVVNGTKKMVKRALDRLFPKQFPNGRVFRSYAGTANPQHLVAIGRKIGTSEG